MTDRDRYDIEDDCLEIQLIDLTIEDQPGGPVDIYQLSNDHPDPAVEAAHPKPTPQQPGHEISFYRLLDGTIIRGGDIVELQCPEHRRVDAEHSGDYLRILKIVQKPLNGEVSLQGHRIMREKYLIGNAFIGNDPQDQVRSHNERKGPRLNELAMHLVVREHDNRPANVQGLEKIPIGEVVRKQNVTLTDKPYPMLTFRDQSRSIYAEVATKSKAEQRLHIFKKGPLVCRWSRTSIVSPNGNVYGGIYRYISKSSITPRPLQQPESFLSRNPSQSTSTGTIPHRRAASVEEASTPIIRRVPLPSKRVPYTIFDMFCGAGGASRGADQAGLKVVGGLDHNLIAMEAWELNNPGGIPLCMDSFAFLKHENWKAIGRIDILNISNPCQPYSGAHTCDGKNDEVNIEQLNVIKPLVETLKPRVVILENTAGLANIKENRKYFNKVLNNIHSSGSGYNLRYKIVNMADFGLPQERKRLIIIAARKSIPLPPFPKPTHGPLGSGLKPYVSIGDALKLLERLGDRAERDRYHKLHKQVPVSEQVYDPYTKFVDCIVTGGVTSPHWSGEKFTPRELALLQSLPYHHHLTGSWSQAIKQIGNMFPPLMAELVYRTCAQTLEAFDCGFIDADEDIDDLNITLVEKGVDIPKISHAPTSLFDLTGPATQSPYRYLSRPEFSDATHVEHSSAWAKRKFDKADPKTTGEKKESLGGSFFEGSDRDDTPSPAEPRRRYKARTSTEEAFWEIHHGKTVVLSDSEEDTL